MVVKSFCYGGENTLGGQKPICQVAGVLKMFAG